MENVEERILHGKKDLVVRKRRISAELLATLARVQSASIIRILCRIQCAFFVVVVVVGTRDQRELQHQVVSAFVVGMIAKSPT